MELYYDNNGNPEAIRRLWQTVFHDSEPFADYYFQWMYPKNQVLLAKEDGELCSMLHLNPYLWSWSLNGRDQQLLNLHYIVGVATTEAWRRQGLMAACMKKALQDMEAKGEPFTYLMPAKKEYYTPFQFVEIKREKRWIRKGNNWIRKGESSIFRETFETISIPESRPDIFPARTPEYLKQLRAEMACEGGAVLEWEKKAGYCAYAMEQREGKRTAVIEQLWIDSMNTEQTLNQLVCPELERRHGELAVEYMEEQPMMLRILHLSRFLELLPYDGEEKQCMVHLTDSICTGNQGVFVITLSPEGGRLHRMAEEPEAAFTGIPEYHWDMTELTEYLLKESGLAEHMYLMEIV
ncbi:MAG: GNAT family N-acetyltransferase [Lachnospiraceae bacterium]|nr:GNAT family N-acetyltransferase [Lachnospiraceae bacterium]